MSAHTPGTWRLDPPEMSHVTEERYHAIAAGARHLGEPGFCITGILSIEDARLMAAAPDLLAALQDCLTYLENDIGGPDYSGPEKQVARAAIANATQSTP